MKNKNYIGFWRRFAAYFIDGFILYSISFLLSSLIGNINVFTYLIGIIYFVYFWVKKDGQTLGYKVMKIKVIREDGKPIDIMTGVIRYIGYIVSALVIGLGFLWVIWDKKKQGWHDKMAGTVVVRT